ncbi:MAG: rhodanese-like domain-containing protein [Ignavibacteriaceae bacterium]|jgi:rhodanese-related sulfurtransferase|nr:rhodanese-like domain-containing protein [Ignavibacteriaceae bacterium]
MKKFFINMNTQKKLAFTALTFGIIALFAGSPYSGSHVKVNMKDVALSTVNNSDKIRSLELADWIIKGRSDFTLVDVRDEETFNQYYIPTAISIPLIQLPESELLRNQKIILYADDDVNAAQAWFILKSNNFKGVYLLDGGLKKWQEEVLFPKLDVNTSKEMIVQFEKVKEMSKYFGGSAQSDSTQVSEIKVNLPTPKGNTQSNVSKPKKKKREGC